MKSLIECALGVTLIVVFVSQAAAQTRTTTAQPVNVVNTTSHPVPTIAQGTTTVSGNVNVTNASLPVNGSVSITNTSVPVNVTNSSLAVSGTVSVGNLPLDTKGNVLVNVAPDTTQYQFVSITAMQVSGGACVNSYGGDFCTWNGTQWVPIEQTLTTLSSEGYELVSTVPLPVCISGSECEMLYTLKAPVAGAAHRKRASATAQD